MRKNIILLIFTITLTLFSASVSAQSRRVESQRRSSSTQERRVQPQRRVESQRRVETQRRGTNSNIQRGNIRNQDRRMDMNSFEKRKMEHIQKEAGLSKEEADKFFPLHNELSKKKFELHRKHRDKVDNMKREGKTMTDEEYKQILEKDVEIKMKEAELEKEYSEKLEKAVSPKKLYKAQQAEKDFMQKEVNKFRDSK